MRRYKCLIGISTAFGYIISPRARSLRSLHLYQILPRAFSHRSSPHVISPNEDLVLYLMTPRLYSQRIVFCFYGGPLTSVRMAHLLFNILQPVPNLLYFWLMAEGAGFEPTMTESKSVVMPASPPLHIKAPKMLLNPLSYSSNFWLTKSDSNRYNIHLMYNCCVCLIIFNYKLS